MMRPAFLLPAQTCCSAGLALLAPCVILVLQLTYADGYQRNHNHTQRGGEEMEIAPTASSSSSPSSFISDKRISGGSSVSRRSYRPTTGSYFSPNIHRMLTSGSGFMHFWSAMRKASNKASLSSAGAAKRQMPVQLLLPGRPDDKQGCPMAEVGHQQYRCPLSIDNNLCIAERQLCNGRRECPRGEDEDPTMCLFYRFITDNMRMLVHALVQNDVPKR